MGLTSCSPPLSAVNPTARRRVSLFQSHRYCKKSLPFSPTSNCTTSYFSSTSDYFGGSLSLLRLSSRRTHPVSLNKSRRSLFVVSGIFEKFTERAIKAVMFSQREAKALGKDMVFTQHLLLGLMAEDRASGEFLGSGITVEPAREAVQSLWPEDNGNGGTTGDVSQSETSATDVPFSTGAKRVFEAAVEYSRAMGYNFIAPEHIAIGLFTVDDGSVNRVLKRLGANANHLAAMAVSRLQGKLQKREENHLPLRSRGLERISFLRKSLKLDQLKWGKKKKLLTYSVWILLLVLAMDTSIL